VDGVEARRVVVAHADHLEREDLEAGLLDPREDLAGGPAATASGLMMASVRSRSFPDHLGHGRPHVGGALDQRRPAACSAFIFSAAVPLPPAMMAPAWPMRRPGGAVWPQMNATTGFFTFALMNAAASSSAVPPISPIIMIARVAASSLNRRSTSTNEVPLTGIAADAHAGRLADVRARELAHDLVGQRAAARDDADVAGLVDVPGHDADLGLARRDDPGQLGR
jgi:hypothetical protein